MFPKKPKVNIIIKFIIGVLILLLIIGIGFFAKVKTEQSKMNPLDTQEVIPGVFSVKNSFVNFFFIKNGEKYIAIDAGNDISKTKEELSRLGISSNDVTAVFLTHSHSDHTAALNLFNNAVIYAGKNETSNKTNISNKTLSDGEKIEIADTSIQCFFTQGHTKGSVCYLIDDKYLFVGDTLSLHDNKIGLFNSFFNKSDDIQKTDIKKLSELSNVQYIFTAHYGFTDNPIFP